MVVVAEEDVGGERFWDEEGRLGLGLVVEEERLVGMVSVPDFAGTVKGWRGGLTIIAISITRSNGAVGCVNASASRRG